MIKYKWEQVEKFAKKLAEKINYKFDVIVGITRDGLVPAHLISDYSGIEKIYCISIKSYDKTEKKDIQIYDLPAVENMSVLIVDDVSQTGKTLNLAKKRLLKLGAKKVNTCTFDIKKKLSLFLIFILIKRMIG